MKKYEFTGKTMEFEGHILREIRYLRDSDFFSEGQVGGWIESDHNLSHEGQACVLHDGKVFGHATVREDARVGNNAVVKDNAQIHKDALIHEHAVVGADTIVSDTSTIGGDSKVYFYADEQYGNPNVSGASEINGETMIEATGVIRDSDIYNSVLLGNLDLIEVVWKDESLSN